MNSGASRELLVVPPQQRGAERVGHVAVVVEAPVEPLDVLRRCEVEEVLVEVGANEVPASLREPGLVEQLQERRQPGRHDRVEHDLGTAGHDVLDQPAVVHVVHREVLLADHRAALGRDHLPHLLVQGVGPDVVRRRQVEPARARTTHQPRQQGVDLLGRHRSGAEDQRVTLLALVLLGVDVEGLALLDHRALDGLPRGAVDAPEHDVDLLLHEPGRCRCGGLVLRRTVLDEQLDRVPEQATAAVDVVDHHGGRVHVGDPHEGERPRLVGDDADPRGPTARCSHRLVAFSGARDQAR